MANDPWKEWEELREENARLHGDLQAAEAKLDREHRDHRLHENELLGRIERAEAKLDASFDAMVKRDNQYADLAAEKWALKAKLSDLENACMVHHDEMARLTQKLAKVVEALEHYGCHRLPDCHFGIPQTCRCGLHDAIATGKVE